MKRLLTLLLLFSVVMCMCACSLDVETTLESGEQSNISAEASVSDGVSESREDSSDVSADEDGECTPLLYRVSCSKGGTLYLLGSIHIGDERMEKMPAYVMNAYNESSFIAVEADIVAFDKDFAAQIKYTQTLLCDSGKTIEDHLGTELYEKAKGFLQDNGAYMSAYKAYGPAMWFSLVDNVLYDKSGLDSENGADRLFIDMANDDGKQVREAESVGFQYEMLKGFSDDLYKLMIESTIDTADEGVEALKQMYEIWLDGDEAEVAEMLKEDISGLTDEEKVLYDEYMKAMLTDRNVGMANKAEQYLAEGVTSFMVVGTAHVVGDGGLVELLRDRGYNVAVVK